MWNAKGLNVLGQQYDGEEHDKVWQIMVKGYKS